MSKEPRAVSNTRADVLQIMRDHIRRYRESGGEDGHIFNGVPCLLLTTRGRKTGEPRDVAVIYGQHGDDYIVVASMGGSDENPGWYENLLMSPDAEIQVLADRMRVRARTAGPEERATLWQEMAKIYPSYDDYQAATEREIPVAVLEVVETLPKS